MAARLLAFGASNTGASILFPRFQDVSAAIVPTVTNDTGQNIMSIEEFALTGGGTGNPPSESVIADLLEDYIGVDFLDNDKNSDDDSGQDDLADMENISYITKAIEDNKADLSRWCKTCNFKGCDVCLITPPFRPNINHTGANHHACFDKQALIRYMFDVASLQAAMSRMRFGPCLTKSQRKESARLCKDTKMPICPDDIYYIFMTKLDEIRDQTCKRIDRLTLIAQIYDSILTQYIPRSNTITLENLKYGTIVKYMTGCPDADAAEIRQHCLELKRTVFGK